MNEPTWKRVAPRVRLSLACILVLAAMACGGLAPDDLPDADSGIPVPDAAVADAADADAAVVDAADADAAVVDAADAEAGPLIPTVTGVFVSGGASPSGATRVRGAFSWAPSRVVTNGSVTVSGGFH
jgi:hypothetical protein